MHLICQPKNGRNLKELVSAFTQFAPTGKVPDSYFGDFHANSVQFLLTSAARKISRDFEASSWSKSCHASALYIEELYMEEL